MLQSFYANGKLLLTGEYAVLDGAEALAIPTKFGQQLEITSTKENPKDVLAWESVDEKGNVWFSAKLSLKDDEYFATSDIKAGKRLAQLIQTIRKQKTDFLLDTHLIKAKTRLEFPRDWGLGSSSTLVYLLSQWAAVNPFPLQFEVFGGSGYDIACAGIDTPILYQKLYGQATSQSIHFAPSFQEQLYFIHLGQKQDSRKGIARYRENAALKNQLVQAISLLTYEFLSAKSLVDIEKIIVEHERLIADAIQLPTAKTLHFSDYWGAIKSLGAWGGDFILATSNRSLEATKDYFANKGLTTFFRYEEMVK